MNKYLPETPQNVRGVVNGVEYPMTLHYVGPVPHGHLWAALWPEGMEPPTYADFRGLRVDVLPDHCVLTTQVKHQTDMWL